MSFNNLSAPVSDAKPTLRMNPKKFVLWLLMVSIVMLFAALTSAYIVRKGDGNWLLFDLPNVFYYSTGVLLLSSVTIQLSYFFAKKDELEKLKLFIIISAILGISFLFMQVQGWKELVQNKVFLVGNPSGSFVYIITGVHGAHLITGVVFIIIMLVAAFRYKVHSKSLLKIEMCATYWHFLDLLWVYLFCFILFV